MNPVLTTFLIFAFMTAVVVAFRLLVRRPKLAGTTDPAGVRTVALFAGDDEELFTLDEPGGQLVGVCLFNSLCDSLATTGVNVEHRGRTQNALSAQCRVADERFALVLEWLQPGWVLGVDLVPDSAAERRHVKLTAGVYAPPDSNELRLLLSALDTNLKSHPSLTAVTWHRKERWIAEDTTKPAKTPVSH